MKLICRECGCTCRTTKQKYQARYELCKHCYELKHSGVVKWAKKLGL